MRDRPTRRSLAAVALVALAVVGCGESGGADPTKVAPPSASLWAEAAIDPQGEQEQAVRSILRRFPKGDQVPAMIAEAIEQEARSEKTPIDFEKDVKPWLGDRAGLFLIPVRRGEPKVGVIVATTDEGKARELLDKAAKDDNPKRRSYKGVDYTVTDEGAQGIVEGFVVGADEPELKRVVDAAQGSGLADSDRYKKAVEDLPEDRVATVFVDQKALAEASARGTQEAEITRRLLGGAASQPLAAAVRAEPDAVAVDSALAGQGGPLSGFLGSGPGLLPSLPADSWLALGQPNLGSTLKRGIDSLGGAFGAGVVDQQLRQATGLDLDRDVLSWIGDAGVFVRGTNQADLGGGLVIESKDAAASKRALTRLAPVVRRQLRARVRPSTLPDVEAGFTARPRGAPVEVHAAQRGRRVVIAFGDQAAEEGLAASSPLSGARAFKEATQSLGDDFPASIYVAVQPILAFAETGGANQDPEFREALPYVEKLSYLVAGAKRDGDTQLSRLRLQLVK